MNPIILVVAMVAGSLFQAFASESVANSPDILVQAHMFTFGGTNNSEFLLDGKPFQIRGGEMHPSRIPPVYWRHRIQMAKAMGLNTIPFYVFWAAHEPEEGKFDFTIEALMKRTPGS
jgi:hypothetical protein